MFSLGILHSRLESQLLKCEMARELTCSVWSQEDHSGRAISVSLASSSHMSSSNPHLSVEQSFHVLMLWLSQPVL